MRPSVAMLGWVVGIVATCLLMGVLVMRDGEGEGQGERAGGAAGARPDALAPRRAVLPPKSDTYQVVGWVRGLKGYVVRYDERLYRGGQITRRAGIAALKEWGIRTIISITPSEAERALAREGGLRLVEVPFDRKKGVSRAGLAGFLAAIREGPGPFYLHCKSGCQRAGVLAVAYRVHVQGWDFDKAAAEYGRLGGDLMRDDHLLASVRPADR